METWKQSISLPKFELNTKGEIRNIESKNIPRRKLRGKHMCVFIYDGKKTIVRQLAPLIAELFIPNDRAEKGYTKLKYKDNNPENVDVENIYWGAYSNEVYNTETGEVFGSIKHAAKSIGVSKCTLRDSLVGRYAKLTHPFNFVNEELRTTEFTRGKGEESIKFTPRTEFVDALDQYAYWIKEYAYGNKASELSKITLKNADAFKMACYSVLSISPGMGAGTFGRIIGRQVLDMEGEHNFKNTEERVLTEFKLGTDILTPLFDRGILGMSDAVYLAKTNTRTIPELKVIDIEFFTELKKAATMYKALPKIYSRVSMESPMVFIANKHPETGRMARRIHPEAANDLTLEKCPLVFETINVQMDVPYKPNVDLLDVIDDCLDDDILSFKDKNLSDEARDSKISERDETLSIVRELKGQTFWHYMFYDYRFRLYYSSRYFNYGASKLAKSLHYFATNELKPMGSEGWFWLKMHASNCWGNDKASINDRVKFTEKEWKLRWKEIAENPKSNKLWQEADSPYEFLAAIMEMRKAYESGNPTEFVSGLPIAFDASCSGLQILAALSKDEASSKLCNLTDSDVRGDYYLHIADIVWKSCKYTKKEEQLFDRIMNDLIGLDSEARGKYFEDHKNTIKSVANVYWGRDKIKALRRMIAKRPCMTFFYSGTPYGMATSLFDDLKAEPEFKGITRSFCGWMANRIYKACKDTMIGPAQLMDLFIDMGLEAYDNGKQLSLKGPYNNCPFVQTAYDSDNHISTFKVKDRRVSVNLVVPNKDKILRRLVASKSAPNVVHLLDNQLLSKVILESHYDVATVHDSFATAPCFAGDLFELVRQSFVDIFSGEALRDFLEDNGYGHMFDRIKLGNQDVTEVLDNEQNFS